MYYNVHGNWYMYVVYSSSDGNAVGDWFFFFFLCVSVSVSVCLSVCLSVCVYVCV